MLGKSSGAAATDEAEASEGEPADDAAEDGEEASPAASGTYALKDWRARKHRALSMEAASGRAVPLIDLIDQVHKQVHKLMRLWVAGDVVKVNDSLERRGLRRSQVIAQLIQAPIEHAEGCMDECSILDWVQHGLCTPSSAAQYDWVMGGK